MTRLLLVARPEKLKWGNKVHGIEARSRRDPLAGGPRHRPGLRVRYGIIGEPVPDDEAGSADAGRQGATREVPDEARKQLVEALGGPFWCSATRCQEDLKLSDEQKKKLENVSRLRSRTP